MTNKNITIKQAKTEKLVSKLTELIEDFTKTEEEPQIPTKSGFITVSISTPLVERITDAVSYQKKVNRASRPTFSKIVEQAMDWAQVDQLAGKAEPKK